MVVVVVMVTGTFSPTSLKQRQKYKQTFDSSNFHLVVVLSKIIINVNDMWWKYVGSDAYV